MNHCNRGETGWQYSRIHHILQMFLKHVHCNHICKVGSASQRWALHETHLWHHLCHIQKHIQSPFACTGPSKLSKCKMSLSMFLGLFYHYSEENKTLFATTMDEQTIDGLYIKSIAGSHFLALPTCPENSWFETPPKCFTSDLPVMLPNSDKHETWKPLALLTRYLWSFLQFYTI